MLTNREKEIKLCFSNETLLCYRDVSAEQSGVKSSVTQKTRRSEAVVKNLCISTAHSFVLLFPKWSVFPCRPSEAVLAEQVGLPHVLTLRETIRDLDLAEVLDALLQLLFHAHFLFGWPFLAAAGVPRACSQSAEEIALTPLLRLLLLQYRTSWPFFLGRPVQRLDVCLSADRPANDCSLRGTGFRLALGAGGGELIKGGAALALTLTFVPLAAAVTWRRGPARRST